MTAVERTTRRGGLGTLVGVVFFTATVMLRTTGEAGTTDWPQWRGPNRDDLSTETGLLKEWPPDGPKLLWTANAMGEGLATVAVTDGLIYTAGNVGPDMLITALDLTGQLKWRAKNGPAWGGDPRGSRGTPTVDGGKVYHESPSGSLVCLDAKTGNELWALNILKDFQGRNITWALSESLLVDGANLIVCPGGQEVGMVALDKTTGKVVWTCKGTQGQPSYASPIVFDYKGLRQIVTMNSQAAIGVNAETGELLWRFPHRTDHDANIPTPIHQDGFVFIDSGYGSGGELLKLNVEGDKCSVEQVWQTKRLDNHHGGIVLVNGYLYGSAHGGAWMCLDFRTGELKYSAGGVGKGSLTFAEGMLYTLSEGGDVGLVPAAPEGHRVVSRFHIPAGGQGPVWAHPVVCGGRLYIRHGDRLYAYDIKAR